MVVTLFERLLKSFAALLSVPEFFTEYFRQFTLEDGEGARPTREAHRCLLTLLGEDCCA
jgi:hypothetical protein